MNHYYLTLEGSYLPHLRRLNLSNIKSLNCIRKNQDKTNIILFIMGQIRQFNAGKYTWFIHTFSIRQTTAYSDTVRAII